MILCFAGISTTAGNGSGTYGCPPSVRAPTGNNVKRIVNAIEGRRMELDLEVPHRVESDPLPVESSLANLAPSSATTPNLAPPSASPNIAPSFATPNLASSSVTTNLAVLSAVPTAVLSLAQVPLSTSAAVLSAGAAAVATGSPAWKNKFKKAVGKKAVKVRMSKSKWKIPKEGDGDGEIVNRALSSSIENLSLDHGDEY